jgi:pimeloyl-ACP methyl ester carboxylesterase
MAQHADDVAAAIDDLVGAPVVVVGPSMGAAVALATAQRHPDRCAGVVLYDGGPHAFRALADDAVAIGQFLESGRGIEGRLGMTFASVDEYVTYWDGLGTFADAGPGYWARAYLEADLGGVAGDHRPLCSSAAMAEDVGDLLAVAAASIEPVAVPVLAIAAEHGLVDGDRPIVNDAALELMAGAFPSFTAARVPGNHYTVALADPGASTTADLLVDHAARCGR